MIHGICGLEGSVIRVCDSQLHNLPTAHQVVSLLGPRFGPQPDGSMGYYDDMTPERVEAGGGMYPHDTSHQHVNFQFTLSIHPNPYL